MSVLINLGHASAIGITARRICGASWRARGGVAGKVWKCNGNCTSSTARQNGSQLRSHIGSMSHEHDSSRPFQPHLRDATDLLHRAIDAAIGQAGEANLAVRVVALGHLR
jgi:hypothetical protein